MPSLRTVAAVAGTTLALALAGTAPAALAAAPAAPVAAPAATVSTAFELPGARVYPEGVTADPRTGDLYAASYTDGTVFRMTPGRRVAETFLPAGADGRHTANGLEADRAGRLWVIDSTSGVTVYDTRTRKPLGRFEIEGDEPTFVNDVAIAPDGAAYLTDSARAVVYRVTPRQLARAHGGRAPLTPYADLSDAVGRSAPGTYTLNGIVTDPAGRYLLTADMTGGGLYRVDLTTRAVRKVALEGGDMLHADGLELRGATLWAVHNTVDTISRWRVTRDGTAARVERRLTDEALQLPTTLTWHRDGLYVVRSQFDKGGPMGDGTPSLPFSVALVRGF
ncbi:SMP-30/gluconolactonase/LRE family protein [Nonomuraea roseoviolacea]|uniref:Sugar lactone lactonase YvrE n=1 Tax=Nonomuraea roseoviolacea subsp. carminata TaxID=160689 RepID=A0ABT1K7H2_9ACTN|nr:SMP-30/gluconolactonase/LRE family protein [Nonomuraea roseoviolacea]MCP2349870.1 sugar lactone lactonase YvrE [Nonomuraea roseoviolacea subsp. carminata]